VFPIQTWLIGSLSALALLFLLWLVRRAIRFQRLWRTASEYLALQDATAALDYIDGHPQLLTPGAESLITTVLDTAWARGDAVRYVSGAIHLSLLVGCRKLGPEAVRQSGAASFQARLDLVNSPCGQRALGLLRRLVADDGIHIPEADVDEGLSEAMGQILDLLRPLAANAATVATMDTIMEELERICSGQPRVEL
jgi:hypothetical protein